MNFDQLVEKIKYFYPDLYEAFYYISCDEIITDLPLDDEASCLDHQASHLDLHELMEKSGYYTSDFYKSINEYKKRDHELNYNRFFEWVVDNKHKHMFWLL